MYGSLSILLFTASAVAFAQPRGQARIAVGPNVLVTRDGAVITNTSWDAHAVASPDKSNQSRQ